MAMPFVDKWWGFHSAVVVLAGALLKQCLNLLGKGVHPTTISEALHKASEKAVEVRLATSLLRQWSWVKPLLEAVVVIQLPPHFPASPLYDGTFQSRCKASLGVVILYLA